MKSFIIKLMITTSFVGVLIWAQNSTGEKEKGHDVDSMKKNKIKHSINRKSQTSEDSLSSRPRQGPTKPLQRPEKRKAIDSLLEKLPSSIRLQMNNLTRTLRYLRGNLMPIVEDSASFHQAREEKDHKRMGIALVDELSEVMKIDNPQEELKVERIQHDDLNMTHIVFQQVYKGIPILGAQVSVHFDKNLNPIEVSGVYPPTPNFLGPDLVHEITEDEAIAKAKEAVNISESLQVPTKVQQIIFWDANRKPVMTYQVNLTPSWEYDWRVFISTRDGQVIHQYNATQS